MQNNYEGLIATMLDRCNDWDCRAMPDCEEPRGTFTCGEVRKAATALETLTRENAKLSALVRWWHYFVVGPDEMRDYHTQRALIKASEPYASPAIIRPKP